MSQNINQKMEQNEFTTEMLKGILNKDIDVSGESEVKIMDQMINFMKLDPNENLELYSNAYLYLLMNDISFVDVDANKITNLIDNLK